MKERMRKTVEDYRFLIFLGIVAVSAYLRFQHAFFEGMWVDEARYARIGEEVSRHVLDFSVHEEWRGQIEDFPPTFPYLVVLSNLIFGSSEFAARLVSPLVSTVGVVLGYVLGREMESREVGLIIAALMALSPVYFFLSSRILIGTTLTVFYTATVLLLFYGLEDREFSDYAIYALGPVTALAIVSKPPAYSLGLVIPIYFIYRKWDVIEEYLDSDAPLKESRLWDLLTETRYYISAGLGVVTLLPWMLRNMAVCSFPLCQMKRALFFASKSQGLDRAGPFFFIYNMPSVVGIVVTALLGVAVLRYVLDRYADDPSYLMKHLAATGAIAGILYVVRTDLVPLVLLTSVAALARRRGEKLMWLWIGTGIGFVSVPVTKVPRYAVFVVPALLAVTAFLIKDFSVWAEDRIGYEKLDWKFIAAVLTLAVVFSTATQALAMTSGHSFQELEPAGEWLTENTPEDSRIVASSAAQIRFYAYPRLAFKKPNNGSELESYLVEEEIDYVVLDVYERTQHEWMNNLPPYRLNRNEIRGLRSGSLSPEQVASEFRSPPDYMEQMESFGSTRMPLTRGQSQPKAIVYRVNRSALP